MSARYWLLIILLGVIWGGSFPLNAILNRELDPLWISAGRVVIGALGSWTIVMFLRKKLPPFSSIYLHFLVLGTMSYAVPFALFPLSQHARPAGAAAIRPPLTSMRARAFFDFVCIVSLLWGLQRPGNPAEGSIDTVGP